MITGIDGYLGWPLALRLGALGHTVGGIDTMFRRQWVKDVGSCSATPILTMPQRMQLYSEFVGNRLAFWQSDLTNYQEVLKIYGEFKPDAIVYLGEQPSAPYSMIDAEQAISTQSNNILGTLATLWAMHRVCPKAHLLKLGTMGEYGTPHCDIPEGRFPKGSYWSQLTADGTMGTTHQDLSNLIFPRCAGSWYHLTKVHDSYNVEFACRAWNLRSTDVMQGPVYGTRTEELKNEDRMATRLDFDEAFGTIINRFCVQAVLGIPLTVYGAGGQTRGYLPLEDSIRCMVLALEHPPQLGEYRTFNQFDRTYTILHLANEVVAAANELGITVEIGAHENPRIEAEHHYYNPDSSGLRAIGYHPIACMRSVLKEMIKDILPHETRLQNYADAVAPKTKWR